MKKFFIVSTLALSLGASSVFADLASDLRTAKSGLRSSIGSVPKAPPPPIPTRSEYSIPKAPPAPNMGMQTSKTGSTYFASPTASTTSTTGSTVAGIFKGLFGAAKTIGGGVSTVVQSQGFQQGVAGVAGAGSRIISSGAGAVGGMLASGQQPAGVYQQGYVDPNAGYYGPMTQEQAMQQGYNPQTGQYMQQPQPQPQQTSPGLVPIYDQQGNVTGYMQG